MEVLFVCSMFVGQKAESLKRGDHSQKKVLVDMDGSPLEMRRNTCPLCEKRRWITEGNCEWWGERKS